MGGSNAFKIFSSPMGGFCPPTGPNLFPHSAEKSCQELAAVVRSAWQEQPAIHQGDRQQNRA